MVGGNGVLEGVRVKVGGMEVLVGVKVLIGVTVFVNVALGTTGVVVKV